MKKKIIALLLVVALTAAVAIGGTLAYLTDRDSEANVFTVGNVDIDLNESFNQGAALIPGVGIEKKPTVTNVGPNKAWVWTTVAVPEKLASVIEFGGKGAGWEAWDNGISTTINNESYVLYTVLHTEALEAGSVTDVLFSNVELANTVDIDPDGNWHTVTDGTVTDLGWNNSDGNPVIHVSAYAIQTDGFSSVSEAYAAYNTQWGDNGTAYGAQSTLVSTADELAAVLTNGGTAVLSANIDMDADSTITIPTGKTATLDLNGKKLSGTADGTGNREMMLVNGNLTVTNGELEMNTTVNQGWDSMSTIFDVTAGGVLNLDSVTAVNEGGTDMNFVVHLNNWGEVTLNVTDSTLEAGYVAVRVFNSGNDMNNVTIKNTTLKAPRCLWVHNYTDADLGSADKALAQQALLNFNIYGNGNTFSYDSASYSGPVRFGYTNSIYCDANGNIIQ